MLLRSVPVAAVLALLAAAPASAQSTPYLNVPLNACYVAAQEDEREPVGIDAAGFSPAVPVDFFVDEVRQDVKTDDGKQVLTMFDGKLQGSVPAPFVEEGERQFTLRITERDNTQKSLTATARVTQLLVTQRPSRAKTRDRVTFRGRGFTNLAKPVYAHYVFANKSRKTVRLGMPTGECGLFSVKRRQFPFKNSPRRGLWTIQFDQVRDYDAKAPVRYSLTVRVRKAIKPQRAQAR